MVWRLPAHSTAQHEAGPGWLGRNPGGRARQTGQDEALEAPVPHCPVSVGVRAEYRKTFGQWGETCWVLCSLCFERFGMADEQSRATEAKGIALASAGEDPALCFYHTFQGAQELLCSMYGLLVEL